MTEKNVEHAMYEAILMGLNHISDLSESQMDIKSTCGNIFRTSSGLIAQDKESLEHIKFVLQTVSQSISLMESGKLKAEGITPSLVNELEDKIQKTPVPEFKHI